MSVLPVSAFRRPLAILCLAITCVVVLAAAPPGARAGTWTLATCTQPDGAPAPADGWQPGYWAGSVSPATGATNTCVSGGSLTAYSSGGGPALNFAGPEWIFTAPGGSTIAGGAIAATFDAPLGDAWISTPLPAYDANNAIAGCGQTSPCAGATASGTYPITHPGGTKIYAPALCVDPGQEACPLDAAESNASISIKFADVELSVDARPHGSAPGGGLLQSDAHGTADLRLQIADTATGGGFGPGVYGVTVEIDGKAVYSGVPDTDHGRCVPLGSDPATGGLIFDHAQPCAASAKVTIPVTTQTLGDGRHRLTVTASDAAGDTATVLRRTITTFNPSRSPLPPFDEVQGRLATGWSFAGANTTLHSVAAQGLPAGGDVSAACIGAGCPQISPSDVSVAAAGQLWRALEAVSFRRGQQLELTIAGPPPLRTHHRKRHSQTAAPASSLRPEHILYTFRRGSAPVQSLAP